MIRGSCGCGAIRFELSRPPSMMATCHCTRCRKLGASAFVIVERDGFRWIEGRELVARHEPVPPYKYVRTFCSLCGTSLGEAGTDTDSFPIAANCLDDDPVIRNRFHEFVGEKPVWYEICDGARQFEAHPVAAPAPAT